MHPDLTTVLLAEKTEMNASTSITSPSQVCPKLALIGRKFTWLKPPHRLETPKLRMCKKIFSTTSAASRISPASTSSSWVGVALGFATGRPTVGTWAPWPHKLQRYLPGIWSSRSSTRPRNLETAIGSFSSQGAIVHIDSS